ncbi:MAG: right-handed parallel beta-helix repeat-containing protein [Rubrivivax sp.]
MASPAPAPAPSPYARTVYVDTNAVAATDAGGGSAARPYKTISAAMRSLQGGDDVLIASGIYREGVTVPVLPTGAASIRIRAQTARTVLIKGSVEVTNWNPVGGGVYWVNWAGEEPQQVFLDGKSLKQIGGNVFGGYPGVPGNSLALAHASEGGIWPGRVAGGLGELVTGSFTYDGSSRRLYVKAAAPITPSQPLEVSAVRHPLIAENAQGLTVEGLNFAHSNTSVAYRWGAVKVSGSRNILQNIAVSDMDGICVQLFGSDSAVINSKIERCGQIGISGHGTRMSITDNQVTYANTRGFNKWWEAGGMKLIGDGGLHSSIIRNNLVAFNEGDGIWIDWKNSSNTISNNTTAYNAGFGIQYEASQSAVIRANVSYGNSLRGIYLLEASGCVIDGNSVFGNAMEGIGVVDGTRSAGDPSLSPKNNQVTGNSVAWNDYNRNWVQLVLPGAGFGSVSDRNSFKSEGLGPRTSMGFVSPSNAAYTTLAAWTSATAQDASSVEQIMPMPSNLKAAIAARRLLELAELPSFLRIPGTY